MGRAWVDSEGRAWEQADDGTLGDRIPELDESSQVERWEPDRQYAIEYAHACGYRE